MSTHLLLDVSNLDALLLEEISKAFPAEATVARPVDGAVCGVHENRLIVKAAPHQVVHLPIKIESLEVDLGRHVFLTTFGISVGVAAHASGHRHGKKACGANGGQERNSLHLASSFSIELSKLNLTVPIEHSFKFIRPHANHIFFNL